MKIKYCIYFISKIVSQNVDLSDCTSIDRTVDLIDLLDLQGKEFPHV